MDNAHTKQAKENGSAGTTTKGNGLTQQRAGTKTNPVTAMVAAAATTVATFYYFVCLCHGAHTGQYGSILRLLCLCHGTPPLECTTMFTTIATAVFTTAISTTTILATTVFTSTAVFYHYYCIYYCCRYHYTDVTAILPLSLLYRCYYCCLHAYYVCCCAYYLRCV